MNELAKSIAELIATINRGANGFGESFQKVAPDAWKVAVYQAKLNAWTNLACVLGIALIIAVVGLKFRQMQLKNDALANKALSDDSRSGRDAYREYAGEAMGFCTAKWGAFSVAALLVVLGACGNLDKILNPEYEAASQLSERFLGK